ncbi:unnamed protein product, partial [Symbiodinium sp. CCMP2456]
VQAAVLQLQPQQVHAAVVHFAGRGAANFDVLLGRLLTSLEEASVKAGSSAYKYLCNETTRQEGQERQRGREGATDSCRRARVLPATTTKTV